jgi:hypothetical protein
MHIPSTTNHEYEGTKVHQVRYRSRTRARRLRGLEWRQRFARVHVVIVASYSRGQVIEQWVHAMAPSSIVYGIANNHHSPSFYSNKQYEQPEKEQEQEQASDLPALALQQVPATAACIIVQPDRTGTATAGSQSHCQTQHHHLHNTLLPEACSTTTITTPPLHPLTHDNTLPPPPLKQSQSSPTTRPERRAGPTSSISTLSPSLSLCSLLTEPCPAAVSHRSSASQAQAAAAGCTP